MNNPKYVFLNGELVKFENANIHILDLGLLRGFGIFDFLQNIDGVPLFIDDYLARFENSANEMGLVLPYHNRLELIRNILELISKNGYNHSGLRLCLTGGYSDDIFTPSQKPNFFILEQEIKNNPNYQGYVQGEKLILHEHMREHHTIKSTNYITPIRLQEKWKAENAIDVLYHKDGLVSESSRSNFFIVNKKNQIITTDEFVLKGITRKKILQIAENEGIKTIIRNISLEETLNAKEAFVTSSTKGVLPIVKLDEHIIYEGKVGEISKLLIEKFRLFQENYINNFMYKM